MKADCEVLAAAERFANEALPAREHRRRCVARGLVTPIVVGHRETPQTAVVRPADAVGIRLRAVLGAPGVAARDESIEKPVVPGRLRAAVAVHFDPEVDERLFRPTHVVVDRRPAQSRENRVVERMARDLVPGSGDLGHGSRRG